MYPAAVRAVGLWRALALPTLCEGIHVCMWNQRPLLLGMRGHLVLITWPPPYIFPAERGGKVDSGGLAALVCLANLLKGGPPEKRFPGGSASKIAFNCRMCEGAVGCILRTSGSILPLKGTVHVQLARS